MDRKIFFNEIRASLFKGPITQSQVDGLGLVLDEWENVEKTLPVNWVSYMLATDYHETAHTCQPIEEFGKGHGKKYGIAYDGHVYYGRGLVQLTWGTNYKNMGKLLGVDLINHPELALSPPIAVKIMFKGMIGGSFTGKKLSDYLTDQKTDYIGARHIINGTDRAALIAGYAVDFENAIKAAMKPDAGADA